MIRDLVFDISTQPDDTTCGPTCLEAIYRYYQRPIPIQELIKEVPALEFGGTLAVHLANHALTHGFKATIYTYNLQIFDPTWFYPEPQDLKSKLLAQKRAKPNRKLAQTTDAYIHFLDNGGKVVFRDLKPSLIRSILNKDMPILTGLSSTYLYRSARELEENCEDDDVAGFPCGHFVVLCGYNRHTKTVKVADPTHPNPISHTPIYHVPIDRLVGAILLGILTYDANMLVLEPNSKKDL